MLRIGRVLVNFHSLCTESHAALHQLVDIAFCGWAVNSECCRRGTDMTSIRQLISRYPLIAFFAIAYILTRLGWTLPERIYAGTLLSGAFALPFLLTVPGPLYAALIVTASLEASPASSRSARFTIWRVGWGWIAVALLTAPVIGVTPAYLNMVFGGPNPTAALIASAPTILMMFAIRLRQSPRRTDAGRTRLAWLRPPASAGTALNARRERHPRRCWLSSGTCRWSLLDMPPSHALFGTFAFTIVFGWLFNNAKGSVLITLIAHAADGLGHHRQSRPERDRQRTPHHAAGRHVVCDCAGRCCPLMGRRLPAKPMRTRLGNQPGAISPFLAHSSAILRLAEALVVFATEYRKYPREVLTF